MKTNREIILQFMKENSDSTNYEISKGVSTQYLSECLVMQRTNISSILNALVKEGIVEKINGRPVLYKIRTKHSLQNGEQSCFNQLIGCDGSLKNAVQLAKAAILYPQHSLHSLILGPSGAGKSYFANLMYHFAIENKIIKEDAPFIKFNCNTYNDNSKLMIEELFGKDRDNFVEQARGGVLFIDNIELLPTIGRDNLVRIVENNNNMKNNIDVIIICAMNDNVNKNLIDTYNSYFSIKIQISKLEERTLKERLEMIERFFSIEAKRSNKILNINSELMICLLLYNCEANIKQLMRDIQLGCANAYVREFNTEKNNIWIYMSDFPYNVRTGLLNFKNHKNDIKELISDNYEYKFSITESTITSINEKSLTDQKSMYDWIDEKVKELRQRGIEEQDINTIISIDIETEFKEYSKRLTNQVINEDQLSEIVNSRIITMVKEFLEKATQKFNKVYPVSIFYSLCLHLNSTLSRKNRGQRLSNEQIMEIITRYNDEYGYCMKFISLLEREFNVRLPIDEVVFITMFMTKDSLEIEKRHPVVLVALHGDSAASSIVNVVNFMSSNKTYAYDMPLDKSTNIAYEELKSLIIKIHQGKGVFVIYDMGSFKTLFEMISAETGIEIKLLQVPITLIALDCTRKVMMDASLNDIHNNLMNSYTSLLPINQENYYKVNSEKVILTLCMSGKGAAIQIKSYIEKHIQLNDIQVIPLSGIDKDVLIEEVNNFKEKYDILCVIGGYDPELLGIRYLPITDIFQNEARELKQLLNLNSSNIEFNDNFDAIFNHLKEELVLVDIDKLKIHLIKIIDEINHTQGCNFTQEQRLALMIHIACCIERIHEKAIIPVKVFKDDIISKNYDLYKCIKKNLSIIEEEFNVKFDDNEFANLISIIKMSNKG